MYCMCTYQIQMKATYLFISGNRTNRKYQVTDPVSQALTSFPFLAAAAGGSLSVPSIF